ncbi:DUF29 domain-containing protein [Methylobacterium nonmethylotrophicum]|uniref:DUF29 domain-containing protein n=1 Tax=Methylobacterium nonmethylotrophicum TaxID=1141884 RepID=A0A4Z0NVF3_9HYPH|nr:DUF29 domain-containing protein [Methylobacterium nonmethylotrophicum]TGE01703.1 DUF29 domain-containing protein [Methylobacterium nonmethylotrophicum]
MPKLAERGPDAGVSPETDYFLWTQAQAALIRAGRWAVLDREALAEEIADLGGSQKSEIRSRLTILLHHLLKWEFQPQQRKYGWRATIVEQRVNLDDLVTMSPSLRGWPAEVVGKAYRLARVRAADETGLPERSFPPDCPYTLADILDERFYPGPEEPDVT